MNLSKNFNNNLLSKNKPYNSQYLNTRYYPQNSNKSYLLNDINSNSQTFKSLYKNNFNEFSNPNLSSMKLYKFDSSLKNKKDEEEEKKIDKSKFIPVNELINMDFEEISKSKDFKKLKKFIPQMTYQIYKSKDLPNPDNNKMRKLIPKYKDLLKYLLSLEKNLIKYNDILEQNNKKLFNPDSDNFEKTKKYNKKIEENEKKINSLYQKIDEYKNIIIKSKKNIKRTLASFVLIIKDDNNFYCDLCPNNIFKTYREVQIHSLNAHRNILELRKKNYEIENNLKPQKDNIENIYLDTKMKYIENELITFIENLYKNNANNRIIKNDNDNKNENEENEKEIDNNINEKDVIILEKKINILEENQKRNQEMLMNNLNEFKSDIISHLKELKQNHNLIYIQPKIDIINKNETININNIKNIEKDDFTNNNNPINNLSNLNNNENNNNNLSLGDKYEESSIKESTDINKNDNNDENNKLKSEKFKNNIEPLKNEKNLMNHQEKNMNNNNNKIKINLGKVTNPIFEINKDNNLQPDINNFVSKFCEREKNILFNENKLEEDLKENYKILDRSDNNSSIEIKKEEELIEELNNKYKLNEDDITKSEYNDIIKDIIKQNQNAQNEQYKAYFNNMLTFLDINNDLATSIIK